MLQSVAIIVAGGSGKRMMHDRPKQYVPLGGIPILARTLIAFEKHPSVHHIILVVPGGDRTYVRDEIVEKYHISKAAQIQAGGPTRQDSVREGLKLIDDGDDIVLIHDGVRPFLSSELIEHSIREAVRNGAVVPVVPTTDTVKVIGEEGAVHHTIDRSGLRLVQTPQAFMRKIISEAFDHADRTGFSGTDDASLVEHMGVPVWTIPGHPCNIKITTPEDLALAELLVRRDEPTI